MNAASLIDSALKSLEADSLDEARTYLSQVGPADSDHRGLNHAWGIFYLKSGQREIALQLLDRELERYPDNHDAKQTRAEMCGAAGEATVQTREIPSIGMLPFHLRKWPSSDESVFDQIFDKQNYKPVIDLISAWNYQAGIRTILDAGANIGCTAVYFAKAFPHAQILCIEPDEGNFRQLELNLKSALLGNASAIHAAVWNSSSRLRIDPRFRDGREWSRSVIESETGSIPGFTLSELARLKHWDSIDLLKIDIEGAEKAVFSNPAEILPVLSRVSFIAIEIHDEFQCRDEIEGILRSASFELTTHDELTVGVNRSRVTSRA